MGASMPSSLKLSRVQRKGQITIPQEFRERLGIHEGDFVAFTFTDAGLLITPQQVLPAESIEHMKEAARAFQERRGSASKS
jgi:AbrB family looped-hinge helix DNA binding protein